MCIRDSPLIYMRGTNPDIIMGMVDFLYFGEAKVFQENLDSFLALASDLQLKGLQEVTKVELVESERGSRKLDRTKNQEEIGANETTTAADQKYHRDYSVHTEMSVVNDSSSTTAYLEELDQKVKSMMKFSNRSGPGKARGRICNVCGKEGDYTAITNHIESNLSLIHI